MSVALMVQGTCSGAGKSLVVTALCRWLQRRGVRVAPFKAQNMSNNARVGEGGELGAAQWLQARAAGVTPDVRMNPILLKPESDTRSQVVVNGHVDHALTRAPWRGRSRQLWPIVETAYRSLAADFDVIVIEGAGSPAETNLWDDDIVNMAVADLAGAPVLLVADIDRGGAFAHLYGTWALLPEPWQQRIEGFLLNKFRGDASLVEPAPTTLTALTGVPTVGVLPMLDHALPAEEGPSVHIRRTDDSRSMRRVAIVCGPYASNLDEFVPLQLAAHVEFVAGPTNLAAHDLIVLPGSKHVAADTEWLRSTGLDVEVTAAARSGTAVLGICGGLQLVGHAITDTAGVEGSARGLGLLDIDTEYSPTKTIEWTTAQFEDLSAPWSWLGSQTVSGYQIRLGTTRPRERGNATPALANGLAYASGNILGVYLHGLFENDSVLAAFTGQESFRAEAEFERLADAIDRHLDSAWLVGRTTP